MKLSQIRPPQVSPHIRQQPPDTVLERTRQYEAKIASLQQPVSRLDEHITLIQFGLRLPTDPLPRTDVRKE